jgi:hypothetical protein
MLTLCIAWSGLSYALLSQVRWVPLSIVAMMLSGAVIPIVMTTAMGLLQIKSPPEMRGRLTSTRNMISSGLQPVATLGVGFMAEALGPATAVLINGVLSVVSAGLLVAFRSGLRTWEPYSER